MVSRSILGARAGMLARLMSVTYARGLIRRLDSTNARPIALRAAMVAEVPCNLTPRHPTSQVLDNLPRYGD